jgi:hypothetical protein
LRPQRFSHCDGSVGVSPVNGTMTVFGPNRKLQIVPDLALRCA